MTPKEKAEELVNRFDTMQCIIDEFSYNEAIECALISVYELIEESTMTGNLIRKSYWQEVKKEIELL